jgi:mobilome CxxCx(11)CxxC protein
MLNQDRIETIQQKRLDALVAMKLHRNQMRHLQSLNQLVLGLSIIVPAFYLTPRLLAKGTALGTIVDFIGEIVAALLLIFASLQLVCKWQDNEYQHRLMARQNSDVDYEARRLLNSKSINDITLEQFLKRVQDVDSNDAELLNNIKEADRQRAYRDALKEFEPSKSTPCPQCGADPWNFRHGRCQVCGGTPVNTQKN